MQILAYAKINLFLRVGPRRPDGFHDIRTVFHSISLSDEVVINGFCLYAPASVAVSFDCSESELQNDNLAARAAEALLLHAGRSVVPGSYGSSDALREPSKDCYLDIYLKKHIPAGAGLAGGSADAAAVLSGVNEVLRLGVKRAEIGRLAADLGSDIPFCLEGGCQLGTGRGETLSPLPVLPDCFIVIALPSIRVPTAEAYRWLDQSRSDVGAVTTEEDKESLPHGTKSGPEEDAVIRALERQDLQQIARALHNDFEVPVFERYPLLHKLKAAALDSGALGALLSGSGSAVFAICADQGSVFSVSQTWRKIEYGARVIVAKPKPVGWEAV